MPSTTASSPKPSTSRRGAAYLYVLMISIVVTTIGLALLAVQRVNARTVVQETGITQAEGLARAAVELAMQTIAANTSWRSAYTNDTWRPDIPLGEGDVSFKLVDAGDANLNNGEDPVRIYGRATVNGAVRIYSVELTPTLAPLDVLRTVSHAAGSATANSTVTGTGGPFSSNATFTVGLLVTVNGSVEAPLILNTGTITGTGTLTAAKTMPSSSIFTTLQAGATTIPFASISTGAIDRALLSPAANPWGAANARGIYYVRVPTGSSLTIRRSRIVATLLIDLDPSATLLIRDEWLAEPPSADLPTLVIRAGTGASITLGGSSSALAESSAGINLNPAGTPYPYSGGTTDNDKADSYASVLNGITHVICPTSVSTAVTNALRTKGVIIAEGGMTLGGGISLTADPTLLTSPPDGYSTNTGLQIVAGSWVWEKNQ